MKYLVMVAIILLFPVSSLQGQCVNGKLTHIPAVWSQKYDVIIDAVCDGIDIYNPALEFKSHISLEYPISMRMSPDEEWVAIATSAGIEFISLERLKITKIYPIITDHQMAWHPIQHRIALILTRTESEEYSSPIQIYDLEAETISEELYLDFYASHLNWVDDKTILFGGFGHTEKNGIYKWDLDQGLSLYREEITLIMWSESSWNGNIWSPNDLRLPYIARESFTGGDPSLGIWDIEKNIILSNDLHFPIIDPNKTSVAWHPLKDLILFSFGDHYSLLDSDLKDGVKVRFKDIHFDKAYRFKQCDTERASRFPLLLTWSPDGTQLLIKYLCGIVIVSP